MRAQPRLARVLVVPLLLAVLPASVGDEPPRRGFQDGRFVDDYFGLAYETPGLAESFVIGGDRDLVLWAGRTADGVEVEILVREGPERTSLAWQKAQEEWWAADGRDRTETARGDGPPPWNLFVQESVTGFQRHHGYCFHARGPQCFVVHAHVLERTDASGAAIRKALEGLRVGEARACFVLAHRFGERASKPPSDPRVLLRAGRGYLALEPSLPALALAALSLAREGAAPGTFDGDETWELWSGVGLAQLLTGQAESALPTWQRCLDLAKETSDADSALRNSRYNLACAFSLLGRLDEAFPVLRSALDPKGGEDAAALRQHALQDPDLEPLRGDERWKALLDETQPAPGG